MVGLLLIDPTVFDRVIQRGDPVQTLFQALVTAIVTGVTVVVSINSLVLSQELAPVGKQREKMDEATTFRDDVAGMIDEPVSPTEPSQFMGAMLEETASRAAGLREAVDDEAARKAIRSYADRVERDADRVADQLSGAEFGTFAVVSATLNFAYSDRLHEGKRLAGEHGERLDSDGEASLEAVIEILEQFGPAREHIKTLYFQWALVDLSRAILYAAVPALVVGVTGVLFLGDPGLLPGRTLGLANLAWLVVGATTIALSPFAILLSYILRVSTVAKRTLAIGPFVLRGEEGEEGEGPSD